MRGLAGTIFACFLIVGAAAAQAQQDVSIGGTSIKLTVPNGFCPLDRSKPDENTFVANTDMRARPTNEVLSMYAECKALTAWREGNSLLQDLAQYLTPTQYKYKTVAASDMIPRMCDGFRSASQAFIDKRVDDIGKRSQEIKDLATKVSLNSVTRYGILREDSTTCYMALVKKVSIDKDQVTQFGVIAPVVIKGKVVLLNMEKEFTSETVVPVLLAQMQDTVAALAQTNQ